MANYVGQYNGSTTPIDSNTSGTLPGIPGAPGKDGKDGKDGFSPTISIQDIPGGHSLIITDVYGTKKVDVMDGEPGLPGKDGTNGFSPVVSVEDIPGGHQVTITDVDGPHIFSVMDGISDDGESTPGEPGESAGFGEVTATVDDGVGIPEVTVTTSGPNTAKNFSFQFKNLKGETGAKGAKGTKGDVGEQGEPGVSAGFGTVTASIGDGVGTPSVTVETSGTNEEKNFHFRFENLKGEQGEPGEPKKIGDTLVDNDGIVDVKVPFNGLVSRDEFNKVDPEKQNHGIWIVNDPDRGTGGGVFSEEIYSTEERVIGTWIDGKPLYRRTFITTSPNELNKSTVLSITVDNAKEIINLSGFITIKGSAARYPLNVAGIVSTWMSSQIGKVAQSIQNDANLNCTETITLEYTKTTDQATINIM